MNVITPSFSTGAHAAPTPTARGTTMRRGTFDIFTAALDHAARAESGLNFHDAKGRLTEALSYRRLVAESRDFAARMLAAGLRKDDRVGLIAASEAEFVRGFCACQLAGLVPVPLPMPVAFGGRDGYANHLRRLLAGAHARALFGPAPVLALLGASPLLDALRVQCPLGELPVHDGHPPALPQPRPDDIAYIQFSSGSTRFPTGIAVSQRALMANLAGILQHGLDIREDDRAVSWLPFYHDMGLVGFLLAPIAGQVSVDYLATHDFARRPLLWLSLIARNRATLSFSPSFGFGLCTRRAAIEAPALDLSCWRIAGIGGDMIRPAVLQDFASCFAASGFKASAFMPSYGMAETTLAVSFEMAGHGVQVDTLDLDALEARGEAVPACGEARSRRFVACGRVLPGHHIAIRDPEGAPLPPAQIGRIHVRGPSVMTGYDGHPEQTSAVLDAEGWLDTGDLGYLRPDDQLVITGRSKDLIIVNGRNIAPQDLEWALEQALPAVKGGGVIAFSLDPAEGGDASDQIVVVAEARVSDAGQRQQLAQDAATLLRAEHGVIAEVVLARPGMLPRTSSGKLSRSRGRRMFLDGAFQPVQGAPAAP